MQTSSTTQHDQYNAVAVKTAASDYYPHRRRLRRVTVSGDKPFYDPEKPDEG